MTDTPQELRQKASILREAGEVELAQDYETRANKIEEGGLQVADIVIPVSKEEFEKAGSKFVAAGDHAVECTLCTWKTEGKSLAWDFIVTEEGPDKDKEATLFTGVAPGAIFKLKAVLQALGIPYKAGKNGVSFDPDAAQGKAAVGVWSKVKGHKGGDPEADEVTYTKLTDILPKGSKIEG